MLILEIIIGAICGFVAGLLVGRNNKKRLEAVIKDLESKLPIGK